jgi:hypothetical protein
MSDELEDYPLINLDLSVRDAYTILAILKRYISEHPHGEGTAKAREIVGYLQWELSKGST